MQQYELEREKLAMELEEERKSHRERDHCITDQQVKSGSFNTFSDSDRISGKVELVQLPITCFIYIIFVVSTIIILECLFSISWMIDANFCW